MVGFGCRCRSPGVGETSGVPLTWFAHQVPVVGMSLARRRWFDSVALCVGSMMPDLMYSFSAYVGIDTHRWPAAFSYGVPLGVLVAVVLRRVVAPVVPVTVVDAGSFRLKSYGALTLRHPGVLTTVVSVTLGIGSHVMLDWFTHPGRPGARWFGYDDVEVTVFGVTEPLAGVFQLVGHSGGSLAGLWLLWFIGHRRLMEQWYGRDAVEGVRGSTGSRNDVAYFWSIVAIGLVVGVMWGWPGERVEQIQRTAVGILIGCIAGGALFRYRVRAARSLAAESSPGA